MSRENIFPVGAYQERLSWTLGRRLYRDLSSSDAVVQKSGKIFVNYRTIPIANNPRNQAYVQGLGLITVGQQKYTVSDGRQFSLNGAFTNSPTAGFGILLYLNNDIVCDTLIFSNYNLSNTLQQNFLRAIIEINYDTVQFLNFDPAATVDLSCWCATGDAKIIQAQL